MYPVSPLSKSITYNQENWLNFSCWMFMLFMFSSSIKPTDFCFSRLKTTNRLSWVLGVLSTTTKIPPPPYLVTFSICIVQETKSFHTILQQNKRIALANTRHWCATPTAGEMRPTQNVCLEYPWLSISKTKHSHFMWIPVTFESPQVMKR